MDFPDARAEQALRDWEQQGLPAGTCSQEVGELSLVVVPRAQIETDEYCGAENAGMNVLACFMYAGSMPTVVMRSQMVGDFEQTIEHELRHWLAQCSAYDPSGDPEHDNAAVWYRSNLRTDWQYKADER